MLRIMLRSYLGLFSGQTLVRDKIRNPLNWRLGPLACYASSRRFVQTDASTENSKRFDSLPLHPFTAKAIQDDFGYSIVIIIYFRCQTFKPPFWRNSTLTKII